ncbi:hypothetical protein L083_4197 [Actinoplanes sp. N902-109]|nr:hypothetical protein L083_4197 [Actinoplanes sp. N902-109]
MSGRAASILAVTVPCTTPRSAGRLTSRCNSSCSVPQSCSGTSRP